MNRRLKSISCALAVTLSMVVLENTIKLGPLGVDVVSAATGEVPATTTTTTSYTSTNGYRVLRIGSIGSDVKNLQTTLNNNGSKLDVDGFFGNLTLAAVKDYQKAKGLEVDGIVGPKTMAVLVPSSAVPTSIATIGSSNNDVKYLQANLNKLGYKLAEDGIFGNLTLAAVKDFQKNNGLVVDGIAGPKTFGKLFEKVTTPTPAPTPAPTPTPTPTSGQTTIKIGRAEYAAHGTSAFAIAVVAMAGDRIVGVSVDEYQFMDPTKITALLPNTSVIASGVEKGLSAKYLTPATSVLASKLRNTEYYSANMKSSNPNTIGWEANITAIEKFATGRTLADLEQIISTNSTDPKVDAVTSATFTDTNGYLKAIDAAAKDAKENTSAVVDNAQLSNIKIGRTEYAAHGTSAFAVAVTATLGDKIVATSVDEYQFMDPTKITALLPNTSVIVSGVEKGLSSKYLTPATSVLASKLRNTIYYSANMKSSNPNTIGWEANITAIEKFTTGKTVSELDGIISTNSTDPKVDAVASATFTDTNGYLKAIEAAAKVAK